MNPRIMWPILRRIFSLSERADELDPVVQKYSYAMALACAELRLGAAVQLLVVAIIVSVAR